MDRNSFQDGLIAQERKISPVVVMATLIIIGMFAIGILYQGLLISGVI